MKPIIAVLCPMPMEFAAVEKALGRLGETLETVFEEKRFDLNGLDVILARCGVGKTFAAAKAQKLIQTYEPDHLFVCGVAGAIAEELNVFDVVVPNRIVHGDVCFGNTYSPTDITESSMEFFEGKPGFSASAYLPERLNAPYKSGTLATIDFFAEEAEKTFLEEKFNAVCIDMESAAVAQIATLWNVPVTVIRAISDNRKHTLGDFETNAPKACDIAAEALTELLKKI
ncbi:MAG: 5'-methylthioadenosine/S-adenosylhomocysteine nucleosidase [Alphaproteobacteria bacterium]|nr:5'-methylthioadenosine/S-adenosylhomocysteine nucleosidase [Alphaproteobacteria bacterium]